MPVVRIMNRREFVAAAAAACAFCVACPESLMAATAKGPVDAGEVSAFTKEGVCDALSQSQGFFLISSKGKLYATGSTCTHKSNQVSIDSENHGQLKCEKHGSLFSLDGKVVKPPAKRSLPRYGIKLDAKKHVIVDPTKRFEEANWNDPGSFLKLV
jgi:Rieske Fe-S protein